MPWTVLDPVTRPLFASRLRNLPRWYDENVHALDEALKVARQSFENSPLSDSACFRSIHLLTGAPNQLEPRDEPSGEMRSARDGTIGPVVDRIDGLAVPNFEWFDDPMTMPIETGRGYFVGFAAGSDDPMQPYHTQAGIAEDPVLGWQSFDDSTFPSLVGRLLKRVGYCPGDFNLDGMVDASDSDAFTEAMDPLHPDHLRADWNFDGNVDFADVIAFNYSFAQLCCQ